jgi:hypothetical protein
MSDETRFWVKFTVFAVCSVLALPWIIKGINLYAGWVLR